MSLQQHYQGNTLILIYLQYAAEGGNQEVVRFLLEQGANGNWAGGSKQT
jgi:hypothetical protein